MGKWKKKQQLRVHFCWMVGLVCYSVRSADGFSKKKTITLCYERRINQKQQQHRLIENSQMSAEIPARTHIFPRIGIHIMKNLVVVMNCQSHSTFGPDYPLCVVGWVCFCVNVCLCGTWLPFALGLSCLWLYAWIFGSTWLGLRIDRRVWGLKKSLGL